MTGTQIAIILHPPSGARRTWYAYWSGLTSSKSTGQINLKEAVAAAEHMIRSWRSGGDGGRARAADLVLSDEEFELLQRTYYARETDPAKQQRAA